MTSTVPNMLTVGRLILVPVFVVLLMVDAGAEGAARWWAVVVFTVAAVTDFFDGYLARRWGVVSSFGKLADPLADKALVIGGLVMLVWIDGLAWWPVAIITLREVWVTLGRFMVASGTVIAASPGGKAKTAAQLLAIFLYLLPGMPEWIDTVAWWILMVAVVLAVVTGVDYTIRIVRAARQQRQVKGAAA